MAKLERKVFFPWEKKRGMFGALGRARTRQIVLGGLALFAVIFVYGREQTAAGIRATRATIGDARHAVSSFRADHAGDCPKEMGDLVAQGYVRDLPVDAWGNPLRLACPGRGDLRGFDVVSDGPDGVPYGLDRVE